MASVLDQLGVAIKRNVKRRTVGTFTLPGLLKIEVERKPATKATQDDFALHRPGDHGGRETRLADSEGSGPERAQSAWWSRPGPEGREHGRECVLQASLGEDNRQTCVGIRLD